MSGGPTHPVWRAVRLLLWFCALYLLLLAYRLPIFLEYSNTETVQGDYVPLTHADIAGAYLPRVSLAGPQDTVGGVDVNNNGIRDDVERFVIRHYPDSPHIRAALLQYARALQGALISTDQGSILAATLNIERSIGCIFDSTYNGNSLAIRNKLTLARRDEIHDLVVNTSTREAAEALFQARTPSYASPALNDCDIALDTL